MQLTTSRRVSENNINKVISDLTIEVNNAMFNISPDLLEFLPIIFMREFYKHPEPSKKGSLEIRAGIPPEQSMEYLLGWEQKDEGYDFSFSDVIKGITSFL